MRPPSRWWCGWTATTWWKAAGSSTRRTIRWSPRWTRWTTRLTRPPSLPRQEPEMSIFLNENSKVIVQGMTGGEGTKHTTKMLAAGTNIVGGVNARKAGTSVTIGGKDLTVFGTVEEAMKETGADVT